MSRKIIVIFLKNLETNDCANNCLREYPDIFLTKLNKSENNGISENRHKILDKKF